MKQTTIWALGGHSHGAPADTMPAYWAALACGADGLAIGVARTADDVLVCAPSQNLEPSTGEGARVRDLPLGRLQQLDAGREFRSSALDEENVATDTGDDRPWRRKRIDHPTLEKVLLAFSRRTRLFLLLHPDRSEEADLVSRVAELLTRFGVLDRVVLAGDVDVLSEAPPHPGLCLVDDPNRAIGSVVERAQELGASYFLADPERIAAAPPREAVGMLVRPGDAGHALTPSQFEELGARDDLVGVAVTAVDRGHALRSPRGLVLAEEFEGPRVDRDLWALGESRPNSDTTIEVDGGLHIRVEGGEYSGGAAFTEFSIHGGFDARVSFEAETFAQGSTFELAAVQVDAGYHRPNLTFDVHGTPPYASSERDEGDGFRLGWNNGPALIRWHGREATSSNLYNNYGNDVGDGDSDNPTGELRLVRCAEVFAAFYRDRHNRGWVCSGAVPVPALAGSVFLRLGAKHWPKNGPAPDNHVRLWGFRLLQW